MSATSDMPRKVIDKATEMGAHNDCIYAGVKGTCPDCFTIIMKAFDVFYSAAKDPAEMMFMILDDMQAERDNEGAEQ